MNIPRWKLINENSAVWRRWDDGREESVLVTAKEYLEWLDKGNTPLPEDPAPEPEIQCSAYQIRVALNHFELRASVEEYITNSDLSVKDAWLYASTFMRGHPFVSDMQSRLGLSDAEVDAIFQYAQSVT